ncbi:incomplete iron reductase [Fomitopsis serialis]|uniref:incomplete iron reductase n=1 Tax=Fomitopsis serialis TaxID=139415 RepID=UPI0020085DCA|nr:incomplete iron reductase [Neoantrodia serialis]KAH9918068.1 incomplete iron reductase [Neoantrodia serialis]
MPSATASASAAHASSTSTASKTTTAAPPELDAEPFFREIDIILIGVAGFFILLALPRAIARFKHLSEWFAGCFFRSVQLEGSSRRPRRARSNGSSFQEKPADANAEEQSISVYSNVDLTFSPDLESPKNPPPYIPAWTSIFPTVNGILETKIRPGYSLWKVLLMVGYMVAMMYAALFEVNLFTSPARLGFLPVSQLPIIYIMATKNNVFGALIGQGYEKLNWIHRYVGRVAVLAINLHALAYFAKWANEPGGVAAHMETNHVWGCVAMGCMDILWLFSISAVRQMYYHLFFVTHSIAAVVLLIAVCYHEDFAIPYVAIVAAFYGLDRVLRLVQTRIVNAELRPIPELGMTRIEIPSVNAGWRAGQHVRIRVLSSGMGLLGWMESHPFTIASVSKHPNEEGLVLMVKKAGDWTAKLFDVAQRTEYREVGGPTRNIKVMLNGPYGGPGHAIVTSFSGAMLVAGGSGITYALSTVQELVSKGAEGASRTRVVELVWCITDPSALVPFLPIFSTMLDETRGTYTSLHISVHYTRAIVSDEAMKMFERLPLGVTLTPGRPRLQKALEGVVDRTAASRGVEDRLTGVVVGVCGPMALGEQVGQVVRRLDSERRSAVNGVELHEE